MKETDIRPEALAFQIFLTENCLSSHATVIRKLPNEV